MRRSLAGTILFLVSVLVACGEDPAEKIYGRWTSTGRDKDTVIFFEKDVMGFERSAVPLPGGAQRSVVRLQVRFGNGTIEIRPQKARIQYHFASGNVQEEDVETESVVPYKSGEILDFQVRENRLILVGAAGDPLVYTRH